MRNHLKISEMNFDKEAQSPYDPAFVKKIKRSQAQAEQGKTVTYTMAEVEKLCTTVANSTE